MRACVVHSTLNYVGGGERVCLAIIELLKEMGFKTTLITTEPTDWDHVKKLVGSIVRPDEEKALLPFKVRAFGIYMRLLTFLRLMTAKCSLTINTHGDLLPLSSDIIYMHFPTFTLLKENPSNEKYSKSLFWRIYFFPYEKIQGWLAKRMRWKILVTNSEYSREAIRRHLGADAMIVYPPVDIDVFLKVSGSTEREDRVVACGRYSPEKNYEFILSVAEHLPDIEFVIMGSSSGKVGSIYYTRLRRMVEEKRLRNVKLLRDVPRSEQVSIYSRSKVFMHAMRGEHFGIAIVEAMAAGLVPVVHKSGGPWLDIIDRGRYGLGYETLEEAVEAIEKALRDYKTLSRRAIERAKMFSKERFKQEMRKIITRVVGAGHD